MVTKVSQILVSDIADYIHLDSPSNSETSALEMMLSVAKDYVKNYTALDDLDEYQDLVIAIYVLVQDMWDNRSMYVDSTNVNRVVESILNLHTRNNI